MTTPVKVFEDILQKQIDSGASQATIEEMIQNYCADLVSSLFDKFIQEHIELE